MSTTSGHLHTMPHVGGWMGLWIAVGFALVITLAILLLSQPASVRIESATPTTAEQPYAPYTAGPVIHEPAVTPYAPYTAGPVIHTPIVEPVAPATGIAPHYRID